MASVLAACQAAGAFPEEATPCFDLFGGNLGVKGKALQEEVPEYSVQAGQSPGLIPMLAEHIFEQASNSFST